MLRSAYHSQMRTIQGADPVDVVWYRTPPGAAVYGDTTSFRSRIWCDPKDNAGIGEQANTLHCCGKFDMVWSNGQPPAGASTGPAPCGSALVAVEGAGPGDPTFVTLGDGSAPCCNPPLDCPPTTPLPLAAFGRWTLAGPGWHVLGLGAPNVWFFLGPAAQQVSLNCHPTFFFMNIQGVISTYTLEVRTAGYARFNLDPGPFTPVFWWGTKIEWSWPTHP